MDAVATEALFAVEEGQGESAPIVFLHGFGAGAHVWADVQNAFAGELHTLAYDLPGHGRSLNATGFERSRKMAGAITEDLAGRGVGKVHLVGHSMGGAVATLIALRTPDIVASMTLLAPGGYGPEINHCLLRRYAIGYNAGRNARRARKHVRLEQRYSDTVGGCSCCKPRNGGLGWQIEPHSRPDVQAAARRSGAGHLPAQRTRRTSDAGQGALGHAGPPAADTSGASPAADVCGACFRKHRPHAD
ncbi:MAG: alpha/beta fold hydrolase [Hyphomicrobiales bacterium]|nr:alpha/beta fold hydrolase [Hyphomicrobiales bacterium]MCP5000404.1 alpha/beta fold hydrolase [Hyphomicrobiales bacterium]